VFLDLEVGALAEPLTGRSWGPAEAIDHVRRRAALYLERGLVPGDRVFLHYGNTLEFFADLLAIWMLGGCAIPIDPRLTPFEITTLARAARPRFSVWREPPDDATATGLTDLDVPLLTATEDGRGVPGALLDGPSLDQDALILFTSGTTGQPKGVVHTHRSLRARWMSLRDCLGLDRYRRTLCLLPTHFGHGLICNCLFPWLSGQDLFIVPPFRSDMVMGLGSLIEEHRITFLSSVPSVWRLALRTAKPPQSQTLERVSCGSAPLSAALWKAVQEWTGTKEVLNAYGITETGSWLAGTTVAGFEPADGLIGTAWGGVIRILRSGTTETAPAFAEQCTPGEAGYVWVNTPALMRGYLGRDDLTSRVVRHGWFLTGDIGVVDERGLLFLRGREREEINKGGMKIYPGDVDAVVERFADATDVCTFGYEDPDYGENVGIAVVLQGTDEPTLKRLHDWMKQHLARHQMPERWYVVGEIPRTSRGKINRDTVAERCATLQPADVRGIVRRYGDSPS
jgi:acyl-CoA synthetase (AMP-forming)/AMP-acid ligase II